MKKLSVLVLFLLTGAFLFAQNKPAPQQRFFCKYCGAEYSSVRDLTINQCRNHPEGQGRRHELYEGSVKDRYVCKYCGATYRSIRDLTINVCRRHPAGANRRHEPAL